MSGTQKGNEDHSKSNKNDSENTNDDLDATVEEFTKAVEEEQELEDQGAFSKEPNNEEKTQKKP